jgi:acetyl esterase
MKRDVHPIIPALIRKMINQSILLSFVILINISCCVTYSQIPRKETSPIFTMKSMIYKTIGSTELKVYIYQPVGLKENEKRPAIIFFFGGGFAGGKVTQFVPQCKYLAEKGMVAMVADYRVKSRHDVTPFECVADAKSSVRWLRIHADELGVDRDRIVASGGSSGANIAVCSALIKGLDENNEDLSISSVPDALVLFNPPLNMVESIKNPNALFKDKSDRVIEISPVHHISAGAPPIIIFHGTKDSSVPFSQAVIFSDEMKKFGNRCELVPYDGREHGFFNWYGGDNPDYFSTMDQTVKFLISLGYLKATADKE